MKKKLRWIISFIIAVIILSAFAYAVISHCNEEPYAFPGAYLEYHIRGHSNYSIYYEVKSVGGGMMSYVESTHYSNGTWENVTYKESVNNPTNFPAVPQEKIGTDNITVLNMNFHLVGKQMIDVNNRSYYTLEYLHQSIGVVINIFVDSSTGIILKGVMSNLYYTWNFELIGTNIHPKSCTLEYASLGIAGTVAGIFLYWLWPKKRFIHAGE